MRWPMHRRSTSERRGIAVISFVVALLVIGMFSLWTLQLSATSAISYMGHFNSTGAFYAAESGLEMALKEISDGNDSDSDGVIGTISDNGTDADDPALGTGSFVVQVSGSQYTATGRWRGYRRVLTVDTN